MHYACLVFDPDNKQKDFQFIAKDMSGKFRVGWIVVEKPWYSSSDQWTYWMYHNKYGNGGWCGGAVNLGLDRFMIDPDTIKPYNQINEIKMDLERGLGIKLFRKPYALDDSEDNLIVRIEKEEDIPFFLWE
jgi:hypothetical protein